MKPILVISTGVANIASMHAGLRRIGAQPESTQDPQAVLDAPHVVLPGVGAFGAGVAALEDMGMKEALQERISLDRPTLCVCLGLQLLCKSSEESPGVAGLGILDAHIQRFSHEVRVPQLGWNQVTPDDPEHPLLRPGHAYYANSFRLATIPAGWTGAWTDHGGRFVAALSRSRVLACQFHPELSGAWGQALMQRWLDAGDPEC